jgi:hypothetical protein
MISDNFKHVDALRSTLSSPHAEHNVLSTDSDLSLKMTGPENVQLGATHVYCALALYGKFMK